MGLVIFAMNEVRKPENVKRIARFFGQENGEVTLLDQLPDPPPDPPADNRLPPPSPPAEDEIPGTFHSPAEVEVEQDTTGRYHPGVKPGYFDDVRDDTTFRAAERDAWFHLFEVLKRNDEKALEANSIGRVTFAQLFSQSNEYRGRLVTLRGTLRRAHRLTAPKNAYGIERYYQTWLQPDDNPTTPMVVYSLYLPEGFPTGMNISADVHVTGFFYKRWAYKAGDTLRTTPVVLARTVDWRKPVPVVQPPTIDLRFFVIVVSVAAVVSVLAVAYVFTRTRPGRD